MRRRVYVVDAAENAPRDEQGADRCERGKEDQRNGKGTDHHFLDAGAVPEVMADERRKPGGS